MTRRYQLTISVDSEQELTELVRILVDPVYQGNVPQLQVIQGQAPAAPFPVNPPGPAPMCPNPAHGPTVLNWRPPGTTKSGPRIGQPYPGFWRCDAPGCQHKQNA